MLKSLSLSLLMIVFSLYCNAQIADPNMGAIPAPKSIRLSVAVALQKGFHKIEVRYFQGGEQPGLNILKDAPGQKFGDFRPDHYFIKP